MYFFFGFDVRYIELYNVIFFEENENLLLKMLNMSFFKYLEVKLLNSKRDGIWMVFGVFEYIVLFIFYM